MKRLIVLWVCVMVLIPFVGLSEGAENKKYLIYVVNSYNPETFGWTAEEVAGIIAGFEKHGLKKGEQYELISETMDSLVKSSKEEMQREGARILADIKTKKPDLVMITDEDALRWVGLAIENTPVVFNGVGKIEDYFGPKIDSVEKPGHNLTGIYQTIYFKQSLDFLKQLVPNAKTFAIITDETTTSYALLDLIEKQKSTFPLELKETFVSEKFSEWQAKIREWQDKVDGLFMLSNNAVVDDNGKVMLPASISAWINENSSLPDTAPWSYQVKDGILVSAADSGLLEGLYAAFLAVEVLNGKNPASLTIVTPPNGLPVLNGKRAEKLKLTIPPDLLSVFIESGQVF